MKPIYIVPGENPLFHYLFSDLQGDNNVHILDSLFYHSINRKWQLRIRRWLGNRIEFLINLIFLRKNPVLTSPGIIILSNISVPFSSFLYLKHLQKQGCKVVLYFLDSMVNREYTAEALEYTKKMNFDAVYTYDKNDAIKFGFKHFYTMYSSLSAGSSLEVKYDLSFVGSNNGRYELVKFIMEKFSQYKTYTSMFQLTDLELKNAHFQNSASLDYKEVVQIALNSKCILDVVSFEKQAGLSLRPYEAVVYNKKLITNNPAILDFPYYDSHYMLYFKDPSTIDESFIEDDSIVDYKYDGRFSPIHFLEMIIEDLSLKDEKNCLLFE